MAFAGGIKCWGKVISDPRGIEGDLSEISGLGFLDCATEITEEKELAQVKGKVLDLPFAKSGTAFEGYEIHMGVTEFQLEEGERTSNTGMEEKNIKFPNPLEITSRRDEACSQPAGMLSEDGLVFGCYVHGFFDQAELREQMVKWLAERKGKEVPEPNSTATDAFDRLADMLEKYVKYDF